jgi:hypothetical protein
MRWSLASALTEESCGQLHGVQQLRPATPSGKPVIPKVTVYTGRIDMATGVETAFGQRISDELDVPFESVKIVMGGTELTPDQGKSTASSNASAGAQPLRICRGGSSPGSC